METKRRRRHLVKSCIESDAKKYHLQIIRNQKTISKRLCWSLRVNNNLLIISSKYKLIRFLPVDAHFCEQYRCAARKKSRRSSPLWWSFRLRSAPFLNWFESPFGCQKTWRLSNSTTFREKPKRISQLRVFYPALGAVWESLRTYLYRLPTLCLRQAWPLAPSTCRRRIGYFRSPQPNHRQTGTILQVSLKMSGYKKYYSTK